jgi:hypothetical protein
MTLVDGETLADRIDAIDISVPADSTVIRCFNFAHASVRGPRVTSITFGLHQDEPNGFPPEPARECCLHQALPLA